MKTKKIIASTLIAASILGLGISNVSANEGEFSLQEQTELETLLQNATSEMSFADAKTITLENLKEEAKEVQIPKVQEQIKKSITVLSGIESEEDFFTALDTEDEKINTIYETAYEQEEVGVELSFDEEKDFIVGLLTDEGIEKTQIEAIKNAKTEAEMDAFLEKMTQGK